MAERKNAIARRLDRLNDQWNEFASNPKGRLLRWLIRDDELRVIEAFVQTEQDDRAGEIPDLFLSFVEPFRDVVSYGEALRASMLAQYDEARAELREAGIDDAWSPPSQEGRHSLYAFLDACISLRAQYASLTEKLAIVLTPERVSNHTEWQRWLSALVDRLPEDVRVAVVDSLDAPALTGLAEAQPAKVVTTVADLDMDAAMLELSRTGGVSSPDGRFRVQFTALAQALGKNDLEAARSRAVTAAAIAKENSWPHLAAAVNLALAGGFLSASQWAEAIAQYKQADMAAKELDAHGDPVGRKLRLQAALGRSAVLFAAQDFPRAATSYEATVPLATNASDEIMLLECWRMASYCHEQARDLDRAWECGLRALEAAEALPVENRAHSTLPFAGEGLLRIASASSRDAKGVDRRLTDLLGTPEWRALAAAAAGTA
jgi:hypothetical protein